MACIAPAGALAAAKAGGRGTLPNGSAGNGTAGDASPTTGGVSPDDPRFRPPHRAKLINGIAYPPQDAPPEVASAISAANQIVRMPYRYGGGHKSFVDSAYDCSGSISYALHGAGLLTAPLDSSSFMRWGLPGAGRWITVWTNPGHAFVMIAGLRFDTGFRDRKSAKGAAPGTGPRWGYIRPTYSFKPRHPYGL